MFTSLLIRLVLTIFAAILFAVVVLDNLYVAGIKQDELANTKAIHKIVSQDIVLYYLYSPF